MSVKLRKVHHVLVNVVKCVFLGSGCEKNTRISAFNSVFAGRSLVIRSGSDTFDVAEGEGGEESSVKVKFMSYFFVADKL